MRRNFLSFFTHLRIIGIFLLIILAFSLPLVLFVRQHLQETRLETVGPIRCSNTTGIIRNADGTYHFSPLHLGSNGDLLDENNCLVHLFGINTGNTYWGNANHPTLSNMAFFKNHIVFNMIRVNYEVSWWNNDVFVPDQNMHFRAWLQQIVSWAKQLGLYVILDTGPEYHNLPCGKEVPAPCPAQNQANENPFDPTEQIYNQPAALQSISELSTIYTNDPAIIFDVWNEPATTDISEQTYIQDMNDRINTVRAHAPKMLVMVWGRDVNSGLATYSQPNLMIDYHDYSPTLQVSDLLPKIIYNKSHGYASILSEFGGTSNFTSQVQQTLTLLGKNYDLNLAYYEDQNLFNHRYDPMQVTANGLTLNTVYTSIFGAPSS